MGRKGETVSKHTDRNTPVIHEVARGRNTTAPKRWFSNMSQLGWCECNGRLDVPGQDSQAAAHPKITKPQQCLLLRLFEGAVVMK